uniref:Uncharacterized protein n=1 Tax=Nelumbo nucifera TaxID=4432 RepID=A0A822ZCT8_NELNU|nr:TPA_asm: hypothetical protein HUJ06_015814 [Nelumbo nucifera]
MPVICNCVEEVHSDLVDVFDIGPPYFGDYKPNVREPKLGHGKLLKRFAGFFPFLSLVLPIVCDVESPMAPFV